MPSTTDSLMIQREYLCLELRKNRRLLAHQLVSRDGGFPRSIALRILTNIKPVDAVAFFSYSLSGLRLCRTLVRGLSHLGPSKTKKISGILTSG